MSSKVLLVSVMDAASNAAAAERGEERIRGDVLRALLSKYDERERQDLRRRILYAVSRATNSKLWQTAQQSRSIVEQELAEAGVHDEHLRELVADALRDEEMRADDYALAAHDEEWTIESEQEESDIP